MTYDINVHTIPASMKLTDHRNPIMSGQIEIRQDEKTQLEVGSQAFSLVRFLLSFTPHKSKLREVGER